MSLSEFDREPQYQDVGSQEQGWAATVATTATDLTDDVYVTIVGLDNGRHRYGPCGWMPRGAVYPTAGDSCLTVFDDDGKPWIVCWTPT